MGHTDFMVIKSKNPGTCGGARNALDLRRYRGASDINDLLWAFFKKEHALV